VFLRGGSREICMAKHAESARAKLQAMQGCSAARQTR